MAIIAVSQDDINTMSQCFDDLINILGSPCIVYYPPKQQPCGNCNFSPLTKKSSGIFRNGGPMPFPANGLCPLCSGAGTQSIEVSETITCVVYFDGGLFKKGNVDTVKIPGGMIEIKGFFKDAYKIQRANYILPAGQNIKYRLTGDTIPINEIVKNRYFIAKLERVS